MQADMSHGVYVETEDNLDYWFSPSTLRQDLTALEYPRLAGLKAADDSQVSISHIITEVLGLPMYCRCYCV